jgi:hypothetical protein
MTGLLVACGTSRPDAKSDSTNAGTHHYASDTSRMAAGMLTVALAAGPERSLAMAVGTAAYRVDAVPGPSGAISGEVSSDSALPVDTTVTPSGDASACAPFVDVTFAETRGVKANTGGPIGNAVVWLTGVTHGPRDAAPRRLGVSLDGCRLDPRVQRAPLGATIIASSYDRFSTSLHFTIVGDSTARDMVSFTDPGQVVPTSRALAKPGLVEIRDARHPWIRGFVAVAPHPFVAVTTANGAFAFDGVPPGDYQLVAWHERLGARVSPVTVTAGGVLKVRVSFGAPSR